MAHDVAGPDCRLTGLIEFAEAEVRTGRIIDGLAVVDAWIEKSEPYWLTPELLRLEGEFLLLQRGPAAVETAEALFRHALDETR
jgi:hypothetical protein